jgi:hypothetical protein
MASALDDLRALLSDTPKGPVDSDSPVASLLTVVWAADHEGVAPTKMRSSKLHRAEDFRWAPPEFSFMIERHGGYCEGSSRAELHRWSLNTITGRWNITKTGHRQLTPMSKRMDLKTPAREVATAIVRRRKDKRLKWDADGNAVRVLVGDFITANNKQTLGSRRKRFRLELEAILKPNGWQPAPGRAVGTYSRPAQARPKRK